jgi:cytochrome c-type biogenesis protein CcmH
MIRGTNTAAVVGCWTRWRFAAALAAAAAVLAATPLLGPVGAAAAPTLEDQVYAIAKDLMCPVCAGQTVADSGAQLAEQMRVEIRQRLQAGQTREEIVAYFVGQFGEGALATPRPRGSGVILWLSLPLALVVGLVILRRFVRSNLSARPEAAPAPPPPTPEEAEQIAEALRRLDDTR